METPTTRRRGYVCSSQSHTLPYTYGAGQHAPSEALYRNALADFSFCFWPLVERRDEYSFNVLSHIFRFRRFDHHGLEAAKGVSECVIELSDLRPMSSGRRTNLLNQAQELLKIIEARPKKRSVFVLTDFVR